MTLPHTTTLLAMSTFFLFTQASNLISDGSEILLLVPALAGVVGSVVLPVLGAVPDGAIVLFSGMGEDAQNQLTVGVGALGKSAIGRTSLLLPTLGVFILCWVDMTHTHHTAGSTVMLLTLPWFLSIIGGRVNLDPISGAAMYKRVSTKHPLKQASNFFKWLMLIPFFLSLFLHTAARGPQRMGQTLAAQ